MVPNDLEGSCKEQNVKIIVMANIVEYDIEWFKNRALKSLVAIAPNVWDYSDSLLLYLPSGVEQYESPLPKREIR